MTSPLDLLKVQVTWDLHQREIEMHERRYLTVLAGSFGGALAVLASIQLEKVSRSTGFVVTLVLFVIAAYTYLLIRRLPRRLRHADAATIAVIETLKATEEE